jgi:hypothetical protein
MKWNGILSAKRFILNEHGAFAAKRCINVEKEGSLL